MQFAKIRKICGIARFFLSRTLVPPLSHPLCRCRGFVVPSSYLRRTFVVSSIDITSMCHTCSIRNLETMALQRQNTGIIGEGGAMTLPEKGGVGDRKDLIFYYNVHHKGSDSKKNRIFANLFSSVNKDNLNIINTNTARYEIRPGSDW